jgi:hypothetical protein
MGAVLVADDITRVFTPPPKVDWASVPAGDDLKRLEKRIEKFETDAIEWRATWAPKFGPALERIKADIVNSSSPTGPVSEALTKLMSSVEETLGTLKTPIHDDPVVAAKIDEFARVAPTAGKFLRKLMRRVERVRVSLNATCVDLYFGILAVKSELENGKEEPKETFSDPAALGAFLRRNAV